MEPSLRTAVEQVSAAGQDEPGWDVTVARAARLVEPEWVRIKGWEYRRVHALQSLALLLFAVDRDEQLDDPALLAVLAPYVHVYTPDVGGFTRDGELFHTRKAVDAALALFAERFPDDGGPLSHLIVSLTSPKENWVTVDLPSMDTPDFRIELAPALEWLNRGLRAGAPTP
ncbi:hypothetical protein [Streptomyces prunicolor]|uniref:hypothetical protein n=1 Tax=Streptomyces prunicolor TaxID=67348 RepID=UPI0004784FF6|nr:hypothetical protein [Streptomyces prunicolor]